MIPRSIDSTETVIDSRDIIARLEWLGDEPEDEYDAEEHRKLAELARECESLSSDWRYGEILIRQDYFEEYAREMLEDCGTIPADLPRWVIIDMERTAENMLADYTDVEFDGETYYIRSC